MVIIIAVIVALVAILIIANIRVVSQSQAQIVERLGGYHSTWTVGLHVKTIRLSRLCRCTIFQSSQSLSAIKAR